MYNYNGYIATLKELIDAVECNTSCLPEKNNADRGIMHVVTKIEEIKHRGNKIFWIGNGGSAAIANHSALDYFRTADIKTQSFFDGPLLTCLGNDFGYSAVFEKPISLYAEKGDMLVAISSSGRSQNIVSAVETARKRGCFIVTMSGFGTDNPLRLSGDINFYVPKEHYGQVELVHGILCHSILDIYMALKDK